MRRPLLSVGLFLTLFPSVSMAQSLYEVVRESMEHEAGITAVEPDVAAYVAETYGEKWQITPEDVVAAMQGNMAKMCAAHGETENVADCTDAFEHVRALAFEEERIRTFGRTLQSIATSYEIPLGEIPGRAVKLPADLSSIINIWKAGTGSLTAVSSGAVIRTQNFAGEALARLPDAMNELSQALSALRTDEREEKMIGAVWRYQYGYRLVEALRDPLYPAPIEDERSEGTERQYLFKDFEDVAFALSSIWELLPRDINNPDVYNPPLSDKDFVYFIFPREELQKLPPNVIVWARIDGDSRRDHPLGDVGLQFVTPLDPVLPSLLSEDGNTPIRGGTYPPQPRRGREDVNGRGLCSMPIADRGFLCEPLPSSIPICDVRNRDPNSIHLTNCRQETGTGYTIAGSDVCQDIEWQTKEFSPQDNCRVDLFCADDCQEGQLATTFPKDGGGTISICIGNDLDMPHTYAVYHELHHAYQKCTLPPGEGFYVGETIELQNQACCREEGEAYQAHCKLLEKDGFFTEGQTFNGVPITVDTCSEVLTSAACAADVREGFQGCQTSRTYPAGLQDYFYLQFMNRNPKDVPATCEEAIDRARMDPRVKAMLDTVERRDDICKPSRETTYKNTIGNNMCYIGQCVEQSLELHRLTGGRSPATVGDEAFPSDSPITGVPLATLLQAPPESSVSFPSYRPELLAKQFDAVLCQIQGLPPHTPPILCAASASRRLGLPLESPFETVRSLIGMEEDQASAVTDMQILAEAVGARIGTDLYAQHLRAASKSLAGTIAIANRLLRDMKDISFPTQMCPLGQ